LPPLFDEKRTQLLDGILLRSFVGGALFRLSSLSSLGGYVQKHGDAREYEQRASDQPSDECSTAGGSALHAIPSGRDLVDRCSVVHHPSGKLDARLVVVPDFQRVFPATAIGTTQIDPDPLVQVSSR
jgi:hypothetical protein